jgi:excinuclease ABC subunit C
VAIAARDDAGLEVNLISLAKERDDEGSGKGPARVRRSGGLKAERVFLPNRRDPVVLSPSSRALLALQRIRDESHRFAIEFQRVLRSKLNMTSVLEELPGIGPTKRRALLRHLGSLRGVRQASEAELAAVPGVSARDAATIHRFFAAAGAAASAPTAVEDAVEAGDEATSR